MTEFEFKKQVSRSDRFNDVTNYLVCIFICAIGIFILIDSSAQGLKPIIFSILIIIFGAYGFWRIPQDYKIVIIKSDKSLADKKQIISNYLSTLKLSGNIEEKEIIRAQYTNRFFNIVNVSICYDDTKFLLNAQGHGKAGGFIDFGLTRRALKKTEKYFSQYACL